MNPVTIKPAIKKDEKFDFVNKFKEGGKLFKNANPPVHKQAPSKKSPEELNDLVNYKEKITKKKAIQAEKKPDIEEFKESQPTPVKSGGDINDDGYDSDTTTVNNDIFTPSEQTKPFYLQAYKILNSKEIKIYQKQMNQFIRN